MVVAMLILIDVAHAAWAAWEARSSVTGAFDALRARVGDFAAGGARVILVADRPPYERSSLYPPYKANRRDDDKGREAVRGFLLALREEWTVVGLKGHEADDVIASLVAEGERRGERVTVVTGDKDLWCLASRCHLRDLRTGDTIDASAVTTKWRVRPEQVPDVLALSGDVSDNVPGAAGVGPVNAALLLEVYGSVASVLAASPPGEEELGEEEKTLDKLRRARAKAEKAAKAAPGDATLEQEAQAASALAAEKGRAVARAKALRLVHASRDDVETSARLVALREDLPLDFAAIFDAQEPEHGRGVVATGDPRVRHEAHEPGAERRRDGDRGRAQESEGQAVPHDVPAETAVDRAQGGCLPMVQRERGEAPDRGGSPGLAQEPPGRGDPPDVRGHLSEENMAANETTVEVLALVDPSPAPIVLRAHGSSFDDEHMQIVREAYAPTASPAEFAVMWASAKARGLDPVKRQIHFVKRRTKRQNERNEWVWVDVWTSIVSIDGFRSIATSTGLYDGQDEPEYQYDAKDGLLLARVRVYRKGIPRPFVGAARWSEYVQTDKDGRPSSMWQKMGHTMLAKCAEALALRRAFPEMLGGLYTGDEMAQGINEEPRAAAGARR
jgi:phage recombination protein Bet